MESLFVRVSLIVVGCFVAFTLCWALWGYFTPGDSFANGNEWLNPSLLGATIVGGALGGFSRGRFVLSAWALFLVASLAFWFLLPDGWWANAPA
jgi:hypothetical protein